MNQEFISSAQRVVLSKTVGALMSLIGKPAYADGETHVAVMVQNIVLMLCEISLLLMPYKQ
ncbi:hypothetical protein B0680_04915 [Moraxella pluranimalium]|uniref:Uncharacterized protein n=1 Tax=Moraxella pluranimalium TaxID=470453 RepID=A0A1T0CP57_9GAMM|nr:hypothetical protein B0680_04915 [Moraxella pluranimalium]